MKNLLEHLSEHSKLWAEKRVKLLGMDAPVCQSSWVIKTPAEIGPDCTNVWYEEHGGRVVKLADNQADAAVGCVFVALPDAVVELEKRTLKQVTHHSFVQTGCKRSWCSVCDAAGYFDFASGTFVAE